MNKLIVPKMIQEGDKVAFISISGGRAGDPDMIARYETGKKRFEDTYHVMVVETPHALAGNEFLYNNPDKRAEDLMWALQNKEIKGIICNMGGDDSYRVLPYIDTKVIYENPKVFMGYSDIATWMAVFAYAGVRAYYGPNVLTPIAQPGSLDCYTEEAIRRTLFDNHIIGKIYCSEQFTPIEWKDVNPNKIKWEKNTGYTILQGKGKRQGRIISLCGGPLQQIMGTKYFPDEDFFQDTFVAIEHGAPYGSQLAGLHCLRAFAAAGVFTHCAGILTGRLDEGSRKTLLKVINQEVGREDMVILENVDFVHHTPMTVLPTGVLAEIDCDEVSLTILEPGVE